MPAEPLTPEELKTLYLLSESVEEIRNEYPLIFGIQHKEGTAHYALDATGTLYFFCHRCRGTGQKARKVIGPLENLAPEIGRTVMRKCGHACYIPSLQEIRENSPGPLDFYERTFAANRSLVEAQQVKVRDFPAWTAPSLAFLGIILILLGAIAACRAPSLPDGPPLPPAYIHLSSLILEAEAAAKSGDRTFGEKVRVAREAYDRTVKQNPGWLGLLRHKAQIEKLEKASRKAPVPGAGSR